MNDASRSRVVALSGGVGGAKLALGLSRVLPAGELMVVANTADDFEHLGLSISPDIDTLMYVLAGLDDTARGWGRRDETWTFMSALAALGGETWFQLGDGDLATHIERTRRLAAGESLSAITADFCRRLNIATRIVPMTDDKLRTRLRTAEGWLDFQDYFVRRRCEPVVFELAYDGASAARIHPEVLEALRDTRLRAVVICPSNPFVSIEPILAIPGMREAVSACAAPVVAVSPIIGGRAVKGPTAKLMSSSACRQPQPRWRAAMAISSMAMCSTTQTRHAAAELGIYATIAHTLMLTLEDRDMLARDVLATADRLSETRR